MAVWISLLRYVFAALFFLDAQGTAAAIVVGQSEALRQTPASKRGTALSVVKCAAARPGPGGTPVFLEESCEHRAFVEHVLQFCSKMKTVLPPVFLLLARW